MSKLLIYAFLSAAGLYLFTLLLVQAGDDWVIFGLILGSGTFAGLRILWEKLDRVEKKLDDLLKKRDEHDKP